MKKKFKRIYEYKCTITGETFQTTKEAPNPGELVTVQAYYQLNPDKDDRPEAIKKQVGTIEALGEAEEQDEDQEQEQEQQ